MQTKQERLIRTSKGEFRASIWYDKRDKAYLVKVPSIPGAVTFGRTLAHAKQMAQEVIELLCGLALDEGKLVIDDRRRVIGNAPKVGIVSLVA